MALHESMAETRRAGCEAPTPEAAARESRTLFETTQVGVERARGLLERLQTLLAETLSED